MTGVLIAGITLLAVGAGFLAGVLLGTWGDFFGPFLTAAILLFGLPPLVVPDKER